jgi:hypothetical protein
VRSNQRDVDDAQWGKLGGEKMRECEAVNLRRRLYQVYLAGQ